MKKILTLLLLALPMAIMAQSVKLAAASAYPFGLENERCDNAFDGEIDSKWCGYVDSEGDPMYVDFFTTNPTPVKGYYFITGGDVIYHDTNRNPKGWALFASEDRDEKGWVKIAEEPFPSLPTLPKTRSQIFSVTDTETKFVDFRLEFYGVVSGTVFEMSEIGIIGDDTDLTDLYYIFDNNKMTATVGKNPYASGDIVIPETVKNNGVEYSVTEIAEEAFKNCTDLTSVIIPNSVTNIGDEAFKYCFDLTSVKLPNSLKIIQEGVFSSCGLTSIIIPSSVRAIKQFAFRDCYQLISQIYCLAEEVPSIDFTSFDPLVYENAILSVPKSAIKLYINDKYWSNFQHIEGKESVDDYKTKLKDFFALLVGSESYKENLKYILDEGLKKFDECEPIEDALCTVLGEYKHNLLSAYANEKKDFVTAAKKDESNDYLDEVYEECIAEIDAAVTAQNIDAVKQAITSGIAAVTSARILYKHLQSGLTPATPEGPGMRMKVTTKSDKVYEFKTQDVKSVDYYRVNE